MKNILPISIVIPTMNRPRSLKRTIDKIMECDNLPAQIVVVDQSNNEENKINNRNTLKHYTESILCSYIHLAKPSLTAARNIGTEACENDIIIHSDDDVDVKEDTILNVFELMSNDNVSLIAGIDDNISTGKSKFGFFAYTKSYIKRNLGHVTLSIFGRFPESNITTEVSTEWAMGFFFVIRKSLLTKWNLAWDENLIKYAYAEDLDFSYSYYKLATKEMKSCIISPKVIVKHLVSQEHRTLSFEATMMYVLHREYISYKHFKSPISRLATRWSNFFMIIIRIFSRKAPLDMIKAQYLCDKHRRELRKLNIPTKLFLIEKETSTDFS